MHETMVAQSLVEAISGEARKQNARPVNVKISCGELNHINEDVLSFAFDALAKGTECEGVKLKVEYKPIKGQCNKCQEIYEFQIHSPVCPKCSSEDFAILPDEPLVLEEIEFETE